MLSGVFYLPLLSINNNKKKAIIRADYGSTTTIKLAFQEEKTRTKFLAGYVRICDYLFDNCKSSGAAVE